MSTKTFDTITRSAIWCAYNHICFYCTQPLSWDELEIDHIIPESLQHNIVKFDEIKESYELGQDFNLNDFNNLVPTHSKCNRRKNDELFTKATTLFYLGIANKTKSKIQAELKRQGSNKNKSVLISKLQLALANELINIGELKEILTSAQKSNWEASTIKLPEGVQFIDEVYDLFYLNTDCTPLFDKKLLLGRTFYGLDLVNGNNEKVTVFTLREWKLAIKQGFSPKTTFALKMSAEFTFLDELIRALERAKMPKASFMDEPGIEITNLDYLSSNVLHDLSGESNEYAAKGMSIGQLVNQGIVKIIDTGISRLTLQYRNAETTFIEQFRADFNDDGIEDIFIRGWTSAVGGSLGYGFTNYFTRFSSKGLIQKVPI